MKFSVLVFVLGLMPMAAAAEFSGKITKSTSEPKAAHLFGAHDKPSRQNTRAIGFYSRGCLAGAEKLQENGPTWQAMRLSRNRNWGHPSSIAFIKRLSRFAATQKGWKGLYIGDISQPRGGPAVSGHQSHQLGLDIDIWMLPPKRLNLSRAERERLSSISVRSKNQRSLNGNWTWQHYQILKQAASDPAVDRIFITAPAKIWMCNHAKGNRKWLQKVRPYWSHDYHFHVRMKCPKGEQACQKQTPTVSQLSKGKDGCDATLNWWVTEALNPPKPNPNKKKKKKGKKKRRSRDYVMADLPGQCKQVLKSR